MPVATICGMTKTTESKWRALIKEQDASGLTVREFAATRGVAPSTMFWWRCKLRRRRPADETQLVPVEVVQAATDPAVAIELVIRDGIVLRLPRGFDEADLRRVLLAVGKPC